MELFYTFFIDKKTKKAKTKGKVILSIVGFAAIMILVACSFGSLNVFLAQTCHEVQADWFFFTFIWLAGTAFGVFGSIFNTYASLYKGKDNEMLISMPIEPKYIISARLISVFALGLMYSSLIIVPGIGIYQVLVHFNFLSLVLSLLMTILNALLITVITCALGYLVAVLTSKIKNKTMMTVLFSIVFLVAYYYFYFKLMGMMEDLISNLFVVSQIVQTKAYFLYLMGTGFVDNFLGVLIMLVIVAILGFVTYILMTRNFFKLALIKDAKGNRKYKSNLIKTSSVPVTLLKREFARFLSSSTYMLNTGLSALIMTAGAVMALIKSETIVEVMDEIVSEFGVSYDFIAPYLVVAAGLIVAMIVALGFTTAPSVSLEAKSIWVAQSLPVKEKSVLDSKINLCCLINGIPAILLIICGGAALQFSTVQILLLIVLEIVFVFFTAVFGLAANLLFPNLNWVNETAVIKQSMPSFIALFGGWGFVAFNGFIAYKLAFEWMHLNPQTIVYLLIGNVAIVSLAIYAWICLKGTKIFKNL